MVQKRRFDLSTTCSDDAFPQRRGLVSSHRHADQNRPQSSKEASTTQEVELEVCCLSLTNRCFNRYKISLSVSSSFLSSFLLVDMLGLSLKFLLLSIKRTLC